MIQTRLVALTMWILTMISLAGSSGGGLALPVPETVDATGTAGTYVVYAYDVSGQSPAEPSIDVADSPVRQGDEGQRSSSRTGTRLAPEAATGGALTFAEGPGSASARIHSVYGDGARVLEGQQPARFADQLPDPEAAGPHVRLRWDWANGKVYQGREFDEFGNPVRDIDFTSPTYPDGMLRPGHSMPEQHPWWINDPSIGPSSGWVRGPGEPHEP